MPQVADNSKLKVPVMFYKIYLVKYVRHGLLAPPAACMQPQH